MVEDKLFLRPLVGLMRGKEPSEIEGYVVEEIQRYRRLRDEAVSIETALESAGSVDHQDHTAERAYVSAMIAVHAQQTVVSTLLDILGYMPEVPGNKRH